MGDVLMCLVDGSEHAHKAFTAALKAKKDDDTLFVLHAVVFPDHLIHTPTPFGVVAADQSLMTQHRKLIKERAEKVCKHYQDLCVEENVTLAHIVLLESPSDPKEGVCEFAKEKQVTQVFVGTRGLGAVKRLLLGSFSEFLIHHIHCTITLVK